MWEDLLGIWLAIQILGFALGMIVLVIAVVYAVIDWLFHTLRGH